MFRCSMKVPSSLVLVSQRKCLASVSLLIPSLSNVAMLVSSLSSWPWEGQGSLMDACVAMQASSKPSLPLS